MSKAQDPFATTSDPNLYVPRPATERALDALADAAWDQGGVAALLGPSGLGKSLLLRVLARRAEEALHCIHVPVPTLDPEGITLWVASRLPGGRRLGGSETLLEVARERPLLLLVEDAELLPQESARAIAELHRASAGAIRAVLAVNDEVLPENLSAAFGHECVQVLLKDAMNRDEAVEYVTRRLAAAGVPQSVAERFDAGTIAKLCEASAGNPARFNIAARGHMPIASRALAPRPPESGLWQDPFPIEPAALREAQAPRDRARRRWAWGLSWALGASAVTFAVGLLLGLWLRGTGPNLDAGRRAATPSAGADNVAGAIAADAPEPDQTPGRSTHPRPDVTAKAEETDADVGARVSTAAGTAIEVTRVRRTPVVATPPDPSRGTTASPQQPSPSRSVARSKPAATPDAATPRPTEPAPRVAPGRTMASPAAPGSAPEAGVPARTPQDERDAPATALPEVAATPRETEAPVATRTPGAVGAPAPTPPRLFAPELPRELRSELRVDAEPPAFVEIDGRPFGPTPLHITGLRPGVHRLVAHFRTGETMAQEVVLSSGERSLTLRGPVRQPPREAASPDLPPSLAAPRVDQPTP